MQYVRGSEHISPFVAKLGGKASLIAKDGLVTKIDKSQARKSIEQRLPSFDTSISKYKKPPMSRRQAEVCLQEITLEERVMSWKATAAAAEELSIPNRNLEYTLTNALISSDSDQLQQPHSTYPPTTIENTDIEVECNSTSGESTTIGTSRVNNECQANSGSLSNRKVYSYAQNYSRQNAIPAVSKAANGSSLSTPPKKAGIAEISSSLNVIQNTVFFSDEFRRAEILMLIWDPNANQPIKS